jgi:hypothetical protein
MPLEIGAMYSARRWLGTSQSASLVIVANLDGRLRDELSRQGEVFASIGKWEDIALYLSERILLWTCTHEREGAVYGTASELSRLGLKAGLAREPLIDAEPLARSTQEEIVRLAIRPSG